MASAQQAESYDVVFKEACLGASVHVCECAHVCVRNVGTCACLRAYACVSMFLRVTREFA